MKVRNVREELKYLYSGELASIIVFWAIYINYIQKTSIKNADIVNIFYPLCILSIILLQGALYWINRLRLYEKKKALDLSIIAPLYQFFKVFNYIMIIIYIPILIINSNDKVGIIIFGFAIYCFAILEQVNYYHIRLSYYTKFNVGFQTLSTIKKIINGNTEKSRISKDILRYKNKIKNEARH